MASAVEIRLKCNFLFTLSLSRSLSFLTNDFTFFLSFYNFFSIYCCVFCLICCLFRWSFFCVLVLVNMDLSFVVAIYFISFSTTVTCHFRFTHSLSLYWNLSHLLLNVYSFGLSVCVYLFVIECVCTYSTYSLFIAVSVFICVSFCVSVCICQFICIVLFVLCLLMSVFLCVM